jgi:hypothetical protein
MCYERFLFNEVAVNIHNSFDPGPILPVGPRHGVSVEAAHHLLDLLDQRVQSIMRTRINKSLDNARHKKANGVAFLRSGRQKLCLTGLREALPAQVICLFYRASGAKSACIVHSVSLLLPYH